MSIFLPIGEQVKREIRDAVGDEAVIAEPERIAPFAKDETVGLARTPELVVEPAEVAQIQALLRLANLRRFPVTPRGLGTGLAGGAVPFCGGVVLSMARMNRILLIDGENLLAEVEPGVRTADLREAARRQGLFYPPDPASLDKCSVGGNASTNAGGPACVKYGTTRDYVMGLDVVLPTGELISAGVRTRKGVVGYDLARLIVGSEGTLGVITKLVLKLLAAPASVATIAAVFDRLPEALQAVTTLLTSGHLPSAVEFLDGRCLSLVSDLLPFPGISGAGAFLLVETDGNPEAVAGEVDAVTRICREGGAKDVLSAPEGDVRERIWEVRREISKRIEERHAALDIHEDIAVPIGRIAEFAGGLRSLEERCGMMIYTFGHAGDGNLHLNITAEGTPEPGRIEEGISAVLERVLAMDGTISGEHGIGLLKKPYIGMEISPASLRLQRGIKRLFDPRGILNPGKIFPD